MFLKKNLNRASLDADINILNTLVHKREISKKSLFGFRLPTNPIQNEAKVLAVAREHLIRQVGRLREPRRRFTTKSPITID